MQEAYVKKVDTSKDVEAVTIKFKDGSTKVITKGAFIDAPEDLQNGDLSINSVNMKGPDVKLFFEFMVYAGVDILGIGK